MQDSEMIFWVFGSVAVGFALFSVLWSDLRRSALSLWVCGLCVGGCFLALGMEFLAVVQWILSTLISISLIFYFVLFGPTKTPPKKLNAIFPSVVSVCLIVGVWLVVKKEGPFLRFEKSVGGLAELGVELVSKHLIAVELMAMTAFLVVIGSGVLARAEKYDKGDS